MNRNPWMDLTPLLDIFLILIFAVLINQTVDQTALEQRYSAELNALRSDQTALALEVGRWRELAQDQGLVQKEDRIKYEFLRERVLIFDLELRSERNQIWLNGQPAALYLVNLPDRRNEQISAIQALLDDALRQAGGEELLLLVTLKADTLTYRYAYLMAIQAARDWTGRSPRPKTYFLALNY